MSFICSGLHLAHGIPHNRDCYPAFPATLSRQDATLSQSSYALLNQGTTVQIRPKKQVHWAEENKENIPPEEVWKEISRENVPQKEGRNAERSCTSQQRST